MKDKKLKTDIVTNIHILGCMLIKERGVETGDYLDPYCFTPEVHSKETTPEVSPVKQELSQEQQIFNA